MLVCAHVFSCVRLLVTPWTVAHQAPLSMELSRQEYWSRLSFLTPGELPDPGIKLSSLLRLLLWQVDSLPLASPDEPNNLNKVKGEVIQSCPTLCNPTDCSLPGFSVHEIFQARVLEWVAISFSRGSSRPRD